MKDGSRQGYYDLRGQVQPLTIRLLSDWEMSGQLDEHLDPPHTPRGKKQAHPMSAKEGEHEDTTRELTEA